MGARTGEGSVERLHEFFIGRFIRPPGEDAAGVQLSRQAVQQFLADHPKVTLHYPPMDSSWLQQVEIWFSKIQRDLIARGADPCCQTSTRKRLTVVELRHEDAATMEKARNELLQGTLDLLILRTLSASSLHGWDIAKRIAVVSNDRLSLKQGSLYPALHRLEARGWIDAEWGVSDAGRAAKFYRLTRAGRRELAAEKEHWLSFASAVESVLNMEEPA
ncbi:hypothetical protein BH20VER1_BH20VER1_05810 [soil metagenome]